MTPAAYSPDRDTTFVVLSLIWVAVTVGGLFYPLWLLFG